MTRPLGWLSPDRYGRPHVGRVTAPGFAVTLPTHVRLSTPAEVLNQHSVGRCVAECLARGVEVIAPRCGYEPERPDRTSLYYRCRQAIGEIDNDSGAIIADGIAALRQGWEPETREPAPYFDASYTEPPRTLRTDAPRIVNAEPLAHDITTMMWELAAGHAVVAGVRITGQWERANGAESIGDPEGDDIGGHAILLTGYRTDGDRVQFLHDGSWGPDFGVDGRVWLAPSWFSVGRCGEIHALRAIRHARTDLFPPKGSDLEVRPDFDPRGVL